MSDTVYPPEKIGRFKQGVVVLDLGEKGYGHIVGFKLNSTREILIDVLWMSGETSAVHPSRLSIFD